MDDLTTKDNMKYEELKRGLFSLHHVESVRNDKTIEKTALAVQTTQRPKFSYAPLYFYPNYTKI